MSTVEKRLIPSTGGAVLETRIEVPDSDVARAESLLICHPHPEQGGTMHAPIIGAISKEGVAAGFAVVRFNFRGVGESTGDHDRGIGEVSDVAAIAGFIEDELPPLAGIVGWSFGAAVALRWQAQNHSTVPYVGVAPPVDSPLTPSLPERDELEPARRRFIVGERDQFVDVPALNRYASSIDADIMIYPGSDHFFVFKHERLAEDAIGFVASTDSGQG